MIGYERWLIARGNVFLPSSESVAKLVEELKKEGWIGGTGHAIRTIENTFGNDAAKKKAASTETQPAEITKDWLDDPEREEIRLVWASADAGEMKYPLSMTPDEGTPSWQLEIHRAPEYIVPVSKTIGSLETVCKCGEELDFAWDEDEVVPAFRSSTGIFAECDECSRTFDPSKSSARIENPFDGSKERVPGGAAHRFAVKVDCGASFVRDPNVAFARELVSLVEKAFGRSFYEIGSLYET